MNFIISIILFYFEYVYGTLVRSATDVFIHGINGDVSDDGLYCSASQLTDALVILGIEKSNQRALS